MRQFVLLASLVVPLAHAEIVLLPGSGPQPYVHEHPALTSLVFVSPETRAQAMLPPGAVFVPPPPLLMRAPGAMPAYPPASYPPGFNAPARPSNRDSGTYLLQRAHSFSQNLYRADSPLPRLYFGMSVPGWMTYGPAYPPVAPPAFNQPARPSNRDNTTYNLDRAHTFSRDGYRKP